MILTHIITFIQMAQPFRQVTFDQVLQAVRLYRFKIISRNYSYMVNTIQVAHAHKCDLRIPLES